MNKTTMELDVPHKQAILYTELCCPLPKDDILKVIKEPGFVGHIP